MAAPSICERIGPTSGQLVSGALANAGLGFVGTLAITSFNPLVGAAFGAVNYLIDRTVYLAAQKLLKPETFAQYQNSIQLGSLAVSVLATAGLTAAAFAIFSIPFTIATLALLALSLLAGLVVTLVAVETLTAVGLFDVLACKPKEA